MKKFIAAALFVLLIAWPLRLRSESDHSSRGNAYGQDKNGGAAAPAGSGQSQGQGNQAGQNQGNVVTVDPHRPQGRTESSDKQVGQGDDSNNESEKAAANAEMVSFVVDAAGQGQEAGEIQFVTAAGQPIAGEFTGGGSGFIATLVSREQGSQISLSSGIARIPKPALTRKPTDPTRPSLAVRVSFSQDGEVVFTPSSTHRIRFALQNKASKGVLIQAQFTNLYQVNDTNFQAQEGDEIVFPQIDDGVDLSYQPRGNRLEEDLVFSKPPQRSTFTFNLDIQGVRPNPKPDGTIEFLDLRTRRPLFYFDKPFMVDSAGVRSDEVSLTLTPFADHLEVSLVLNRAWLDDPERRYPVIADPSIVYVAQNFSVLFTTSTVSLNGIVASSVIGQANFTSAVASLSQSGLNTPTDVAMDSAGNLWISDAGSNRILRFSPPFANGMNANLVIGAANFTSSTTSPAPPTQSSIDLCNGAGPGGLVIDSSGNLWVADNCHDRVLKFAPTQAIVDASTQTQNISIVSALGNTITITLPGNSLPLGTQITISANANPPSAVSNAGRAISLLNPIAVDINTSNGAQPSLPVTITMNFKGSDLPSGLSKSNFKVAYFDIPSNGWVPLNPTSIDSTNNIATAQTSHFTTFALLGFAAQTAVGNTIIYPVPWKPGSSDGRFNASLITFSNMPTGASIKIFKLTGEIIKSATADASGTFLWDGTNNAGGVAASGVYPVVIEGGGDHIRKRIVVIR